MPDVQGKLDEIITMVETAKGKALSGSSAVIDRSALLGALEELRQLLPAEMSEARSLLRERSAVQDEARAQADRLLGQARIEADRTVAAARQERSRLVAESELVEEAERAAAEVAAAADTEAERMRQQTDDYVDASLVRFQELLTAALDTVSRGRARVAASRGASDAPPYVDLDSGQHADPPPYTGSPDVMADSDANPRAADVAAGDYPNEGLRWDSHEQQGSPSTSAG